MLFRSIYISTILLMITLISSFNSSYSQKHRVRILFVIDGIKQGLNQNTRLIFVNKNDTIKAVLDSSGYLIRSKELKHKEYDISFFHQEYVLAFKNVPTTMLIPDQDFEWEFGIDNKPFDKSLGLLKYDEYSTDTLTKKLEYWAFKPLERGDGIVAVNKIN